MQYRREIDGLRAIAILPVIFFHAGLTMFEGGYLGVDVFFVISGYLITSILIGEIEADNFSYLRFYERRARRLLPALFFVCIASIAAAQLTMLPTQYEDFSRSLVATMLFASNLHFYFETGYFEAAAELKPLLHTWSLAVEEQFYIVFPVALSLVMRKLVRAFIPLILLGIGCSVFLAHHYSVQGSDASFFLPFFRLWELLVGSFAAWCMTRYRVEGNQLLAFLGLCLVVVSMLIFGKTTPTPSFYTAVPVMGTFLLILFSKDGLLVNKALSWQPLVFVGLLSYSLYLWHQPVLAFARLISPEEFATNEIIGLLGLCLVLSYVSYRWIEQPFRRGFNTSTIFLTSAIGICSLSAVGLLGISQAENIVRLNRQPPNLEWSSLGQRIETEGLPCNRNTPLQLTESLEVTGCTFGANAGAPIILLGDSHSEALAYKLEELALHRNLTVYWLKIQGCQPVPFIYANKIVPQHSCEKAFDAMASAIERLDAPTIISVRWTNRLYPIDGFNLDMPYKNSLGNQESERYREYFALTKNGFSTNATDKEIAMITFFEGLASASRGLYVVDPVPETAIDINDINWRHYNREGEVLLNISTPSTDYLERHRFFAKIKEKLVDNPKITFINTFDLFCTHGVENKCLMQKDGVPLYLDDDHISDNGALLILKQLLDAGLLNDYMGTSHPISPRSS